MKRYYNVSLRHGFDELIDLLQRILGNKNLTPDNVRNWVDRTGDDLEKMWRELEAIWKKIVDEVKSGKDEVDFETVLNFFDSAYIPRVVIAILSSLFFYYFLFCFKERTDFLFLHF